MCEVTGCGKPAKYGKNRWCAQHFQQRREARNPTLRHETLLSLWAIEEQADRYCPECQTGTLQWKLIPQNKYQAAIEHICSECRNWWGHTRGHRKVTQQQMHLLRHSVLAEGTIPNKWGLYNYDTEGRLLWTRASILAGGHEKF